ncbi:MAG: sigma 54-interacting transcriptional regulator [Acidobacteriota bacterium]
MTDLPEGSRFRLQGPDEQFWLQPGENAIGSSPRNDIALSSEGVSRHHAVVTLEDAGLEVRDLGSKNGTLVNGCAVSSSPLATGDVLGVGPVSFEVIALDRDDAELGIELQRPRLPLPATDGSRATATLLQTDRDTESLHLRFVGDFFARWLDGQAGHEMALLGLVDFLGARGCLLFEGGNGSEAIVRAAAGGCDDLPSEWRAAEVFAEVQASTDPGDVETRQQDSDYAALEIRGERYLALAALGLGEDAADPGLLLATLVRLIGGLEERRPAAHAKRSEEALRLPEGIVPSVVPEMRALYEQIALLRQGDLPVLILGESGVGKEHIARLVHDSSARLEQPFVAINCAAIPSELLEAEMFGIGRGVATGVTSREGKFRLADGGTLFLDEIGDMSPELQAKLLRALQEREIVPLGREPVRVDVRVVAATNTELAQRMADGAFRQDLYYRLAGYEIEVPSLRRRRADLPALIGHFVRTYSEEIGKSIRGVSVKALRRLTHYAWPGNVRELKNIVRRLVYVCPTGQTIESAHLPPLIADPQPEEPTLDDLRLGDKSLPSHLEAIERRMIRQALAATHRNQTQAAKLLGISRNGLAYRLKRLGMEGESSSD